MAKSMKERVQKRCNTLRMAGLRPVQIWVPDAHKPGFDAECRRQSRLAAKADKNNANLSKLMDDLLADVDGWTG